MQRKHNYIFSGKQELRSFIKQMTLENTFRQHNGKLKLEKSMKYMKYTGKKTAQ